MASTAEVEHDEDPSESVIDEGDEDNASDYEENAPVSSADIKIPDLNEEDEDVRVAMEMALAAMKNPHMSAEVRKKVLGDKNPQAEFLKQVEEKKAKKLQQERIEAEKRWNEQKESFFSIFSSGAAAFAQATEEYQWAADKVKYADKIRSDEKVREIRKAIKAKRKTLKAVRLQGNRVETRHVFKRQRMEKHLIEVHDSIERLRAQFCQSNYNVTVYAKAMMKASKKWNKPTQEDQELALEAQLCRNMHQMLALEKQKAKVKKNMKEIKKYLQRCKSWLSDKQALCEQHMLTLDATQNSMRNIYQETVARQDQWIARILKEEGLEMPAVLDQAKDIVAKYDEIPTHAGPGAFLLTLRGLPFKDSIYLKQGSFCGNEVVDNKLGTNPVSTESVKVVIEGAPPPPPPPSANDKKNEELYIQTTDDAASINSALTDPDDEAAATPAASNTNDFSDSISGNIAFGDDAPWLGVDEELGKEDEEDGDEDNRHRKKKSGEKKSGSGVGENHKTVIKNGVNDENSSPKNFKKAPLPSDHEAPVSLVKPAENGSKE